MKKVKMSLRLPCKVIKEFVFDYYGDNDIDESIKGNVPTREFVDNYLLYVPELYDYPGIEIRRSTVIDFSYE